MATVTFTNPTNNTLLVGHRTECGLNGNVELEEIKPGATYTKTGLTQFHAALIAAHWAKQGHVVTVT